MNSTLPYLATPRLWSRCGWLALALCLWSTVTQPSSAQVIRRRGQSTVSLLSNQIYADAVALRATGDFLVSHGLARNLEAEAASKEMDNAEKWVSTYFERRRLNREARAAENPSYLDRLEKRQENYRRIHDKNLPALGTDLSEELNWMLREILANTSYSSFMSDHPNSLISSELNMPLSTDDRHQIQLTEGKLAGGKAMKFRADTAELLETRWPMALREKRFEAARKAFEDARDWAIGDLKETKEVTEDNQAGLMAAVDRLSSELKEAYPRERRRSLSPHDGLAYITAERFLRSLAVSTFRLIETNSSLAFDQSYRFQGRSVGELLQHMLSKGLQFAPAEPGGEATYGKLYKGVRDFYIKLVPKPEK